MVFKGKCSSFPNPIDNDIGIGFVCRWGFFTDKIAEILRRVDSNYPTKWIRGLRLCTGGCKQEYNKMVKHVEKVALGLEAGDKIFGMASKASKGEGVKEVVPFLERAAPYLGALAPLVGIIGTFGESEEMQRLNFVVELISEGFNHMNLRFDEIKLQMEELQNVVELAHIETRLFDHVQTLSNVQKDVDGYLKAVEDKDWDGIKDFKDILVAEERDLRKSIRTVFNVFLGEGTPELCPKLALLKKGDRQKVMGVVIPLYTRLIQGVSDYFLIRSLRNKGSSSSRAIYKKQIKDTHEHIYYCDQEMESALWLTYWKSDLQEAMSPYSKGGSVNGLADKIKNKLSKKYFWLDWLVAVYGDIYGGDNHWSGVCNRGGAPYYYQHLHWNKRYNIVVRSVDSGKSTYAYKLRVNFPDYLNDAEDLFYRMPEYIIKGCTYPVRGVVRRKVVLALRTPRRRTYHHYIWVKRCYSCWLCSEYCRRENLFRAYILG